MPVLKGFKVTALVAALVAGPLSGPVSAQSLEQMAGQMIVVGFPGDSVDDSSVRAIREEISAGLLGGVMFLKTNVASLGAVKAINTALRSANTDLPPFITIDQEGGAVERLTEDVGFPETPAAQVVAETMTTDGALKTYRSMAQRLAQLGFTVNFGPVADVNTNPDNPVIGRFGRSFSSDAWTVFEYSAAFLEAHHEAGILTAMKHFPGHGSSTEDSHEGFVDLTETWDESELGPYKYLMRMKAPVDMIMVGHLYNARFGGEGELPATLSPYWIGERLRGELQFNGVVITDDLEMGAIREHFGFEETILRAVRAGVDVLLYSNTVDTRRSLASEIRAVLVAEAERDPAFRARIEESYRRIVALKRSIAPVQASPDTSDAPSDASQELRVAPIPMPRPVGR